MNQTLPLNNFKWISKIDIKTFTSDKILSSGDDDSVGYIFEVSILYLKSLHDSHNDLPFLIEQFKIEQTQKLCATFHNKNNYILHYRLLKQAIIVRS